MSQASTNRTSSEISAAMAPDITVHQAAAHQCGRINWVLVVLPATCRSFALIYPPCCFLPLPPPNRHGTLSLDHHWLSSNDIEIASLPLPCAHTSQMLFGWQWPHAKNQAWRAISNWADCVQFSLASIIHFYLFIFLSGGRTVMTSAGCSFFVSWCFSLWRAEHDNAVVVSHF